MEKQMTDAERRAMNKLIREWQLLRTEQMQNRSEKRIEEIKGRIKELENIFNA